MSIDELTPLESEIYGKIPALSAEEAREVVKVFKSVFRRELVGKLYGLNPSIEMMTEAQRGFDMGIYEAVKLIDGKA